jgi:hypothetical protein
VDTSCVLKLRLEVLSETVAGATPVPLKATDCGLPAALSEIVTTPLAMPLACGVKETLIEQLAPPASETGQLLVSAKG